MDWEEFYFRCSVIVISCLGAFAYCAFEHRYPAKSATWAAPLLSAMVLMGDLIPYACGDLGWGPVEKHSQNENHWVGWRVSRGGAWVEPCLKLHLPTGALERALCLVLARCGPLYVRTHIGRVAAQGGDVRCDGPPAQDDQDIVEGVEPR